MLHNSLHIIGIVRRSQVSSAKSITLYLQALPGGQMWIHKSRAGPFGGPSEALFGHFRPIFGSLGSIWDFQGLFQTISSLFWGLWVLPEGEMQIQKFCAGSLGVPSEAYFGVSGPMLSLLGPILGHFRPILLCLGPIQGPLDPHRRRNNTNRTEIIRGVSTIFSI